MIPFEKLESAATPDGRMVELNRRGEHYFLCVDRVPHDASDSTACQRVMAREAFQALKVKRQPRVLVEGLALGFVLKGALEILPPRAQITVAEGVPEIPAWFGTRLAALHGGPLLADARVSVRLESVFRCLAESDQPGYDAVVLDPEFGICPAFRPASAKTLQGPLQRLKAGLRSGGRLVIRLEKKLPALTRALRADGFSLDENLVHPSGRERGRKHLILTGVLPYESPHQHAASP